MGTILPLPALLNKETWKTQSRKIYPDEEEFGKKFLVVLKSPQSVLWTYENTFRKKSCLKDRFIHSSQLLKTFLLRSQGKKVTEVR